MLLLAFITIAPFLYFISLSLSKYAETFDVFLWPTSFVWQNYVEAWKTIKISLYYRNSLYVTFLALSLNLLIGSMAAHDAIKTAKITSPSRIHRAILEPFLIFLYTP